MEASRKNATAGDTIVAGGLSRLETLPDGVIEKLRKREFTSGEIIGDRYRLKSLLGAGAMGQVFIAENLTTGVEVAVKLLKPELIASPEFRRRFQKEAEAVGSISHQNVARFFDLCVGDPTFLVMEHVTGPTLRQVIDHEVRLPCERAIRIAARLCWGLEAAHARGIVHRDLKPANIILALDPEVGDQPKIVDFGLAKHAANTEATQLTHAGQILGTPEYMPPEQVEGKPIDVRADVYALGCVLYEMICGRTPFGGGGEDAMQVLYAQLHRAPRPLSELVPDIPPKLDEVIARALAKDPAQRYEDTRELARALNRIDRRRSEALLERPSLSSFPPVQAKGPPLLLVAVTMLAVGAVAGVLLGRTRSRDGGALAAPVAAAREGAGGDALLLITSTPDGATVEIDGKAVPETTPTAIRGAAPGPHTVRLRAKGRATVERNVTIARDGRVAISVNLPAPERSVFVRSVPAGAMVFLDSHLIGPAPATVVVSQDDFHELRLEKLGFATLIRPIKPDDHDPELALTMELDQHPHSELQIDSAAEASIFLDGVDTGLETPAMGVGVTPGRHTLQLRDSSGAMGKITTIEIRPGETVRVVMNL